MTVDARTELSDAVGTTGNSAGRAAGSGPSPLPWILLLWGGWALVYGTRLRWVIPGADWSQAFAYALPEALIWALLTPGIMIVSRRWPVPGSSPRTAAIVHLTVGCLVSFLQPLLHGVLEWTFGGGAPWTYAAYALPHRFQANLVLYTVIVLGLSWREERARRIASQLRGAELRAQLDRAKLSALRAQIRPHFVLNCLHSISSLAASSPRSSQRMVGNLGRLLRSTLYSGDVDIVPLDSELAALEPYLEIEKVRLGERLETSIRLGPEAGERMVPVLLLQPLVENAIRHGVAKRTGKGTVRVAARTWRDGVFLRVRDRGAGKSCDRPRAPGEGIALANIVARMETLYGGAGRLDVRVRDDGATARVFIPPLKDLSVGGASC